MDHILSKTQTKTYKRTTRSYSRFKNWSQSGKIISTYAMKQNQKAWESNRSTLKIFCVGKYIINTVKKF